METNKLTDAEITKLDLVGSAFSDMVNVKISETDVRNELDRIYAAIQRKWPLNKQKYILEGMRKRLKV